MRTAGPAMATGARIDPDRLLADLRALAEIGRWLTGVHRPTYSPDDMAARRWLAEKLAAAGLAVEIDGIGNVLGRSPNPGKTLLIGSHVETQPHGGWLDGALGVVYGLEIARALPGAPIDVAAWADEEGHFGSFIGSRSYIGALTEAEIDAAVNRHGGVALRAALDAAGLAGRPRRLIERERHRSYIEAHIEQGDELDSSGDRLGIVTAIVGAETWRISFEGVQNHAGTTRMAIRRDAGVALVRLASAIERRFPQIAGPRSVWTVGRITLQPGAASIVPGAAEMIFQFRDTDPVVLARMGEALAALIAEADAQGPCRVRAERLAQTAPQAMDPSLQDALERAAEARAPGRHRRMPSGAGHDAQILAQRLPAAMLFVPSIGGISHHHAENTRDEDIVLGCAVLADAAAALTAIV
jgi:beta-ureidopropionase / N-carbamoyl-L-amino-acid hydrolase